MIHTAWNTAEEDCRETIIMYLLIMENQKFILSNYGGDGWKPDEEYTGWRWYLARKDNGAWTLLTWGYA